MRPSATFILTTALLAHSCGSPDAETEPTDDARAAAPDIVVPGQDPRWDSLIQLLVGEWEDRDAGKGHVFHEQWRMTDEAFCSGTGFVLAGRDTVSVEYLALHWGDSGAYYSVRVPSQNAGEFVHFKLVPGPPDSMVFVEPAHDFPSRIVYRRVEDGWAVDLSGAEQGQARRMHLQFSARHTEAQP